MAITISTINVSMATTLNGTLVNTTMAPQLTSTLGDVILHYLAVVFSILVLIVGLIGNLLVLLVFGMRYKKLKTCEMFMVSLAVSDLLGTIIVPSNSLIQLFEHSFNPIGDFGCKVISFFSMTSVAVSAITLVVISTDRFVIVKWPLRERVQYAVVCYVIAASWLLGSGIGGIFFFGSRIRMHEDEGYAGMHRCQDFGSLSTRKLHVFAAMSIEIFIPLVTMTILYALIIYELRKGSRNELFKNHEREMRLRLKRNRKATILLVVIVIVFYVCVIPVNLFYLIYMYEAVNLSGNNTYRVFSFLSMLQMINSCANPVIYSKLHTSFRRTTLRLFCSCCISKFKGYRWGSFGESFRYAMTTTMSMRSKRSSRGSIASIRDMHAARKSLTADDINHNRRMTECKRLSTLSQGTGSTNSRLHFSDERRSMSVDEPRFRKQLSDGDDEVFHMSPLARNNSLRQLVQTARSQSSLHAKDSKHITINNFTGSPKNNKKKNKYRNSNGGSPRDSRFLSPTTNCKYEYPIKSASSSWEEKNGLLSSPQIEEAVV